MKRINNDLVYTGRALTLGNAGQPHQKRGRRFLRAFFVDAHILGDQNIQIAEIWLKILRYSERKTL